MTDDTAAGDNMISPQEARDRVVRFLDGNGWTNERQIANGIGVTLDSTADVLWRMRDDGIVLGFQPPGRAGTCLWRTLDDQDHRLIARIIDSLGDELDPCGVEQDALIEHVVPEVATCGKTKCRCASRALTLLLYLKAQKVIDNNGWRVWVLC